MNLITKILDQYYDLTHSADQNYQHIIMLRDLGAMDQTYRERPDIQAADALLAVQYSIIRGAARDWQKFLKARRILSPNLFASSNKATPDMAKSVERVGKKLNLISDCYDEAFITYSGLVAAYQTLLERVEAQQGFSHFDIIDLLEHYIEKLLQAGFSRAAINHACQHTVQERNTPNAMQAVTLESLINMDKDFRKLIHTSATLFPAQQSANLSAFFNAHYTDTNMPELLLRQLQLSHVLSTSVTQQTTTIWSAPTPPSSAPPVLQPYSNLKSSM